MTLEYTNIQPVLHDVAGHGSALGFQSQLLDYTLPRHRQEESPNQNVIKLDLGEGMHFDDGNNQGILDFGAGDEYTPHRQMETTSKEKGKMDDDYKPISFDDWPDKQAELSNDEDLIIQEEVDDFPDFRFNEVWRQKCWDILYRLYYDVDSGPFLQDISEEVMGRDFYEDYITTIEHPINFLMIKQKMIKHMYLDHRQFIEDVLLCFDNCTLYNARNSGYYKSATKMKRTFKQLLHKYDIRY